jgi:hypothetical protein
MMKYMGGSPMPVFDTGGASISNAWRCYFLANQSDQEEVPWDDAYSLSPAERRNIR